VIRRSLYDERMRDLAIMCFIVAGAAIAVWLWGPK